MAKAVKYLPVFECANAVAGHVSVGKEATIAAGKTRPGLECSVLSEF